jgi:hypothetical protein
MATQLSIVNKLLGRLRENKVTSTQDSPYAILLAQIVAEAYAEVLDEWNWETLNKVCAVDVPAGTSTLPITDVTYGDLPTGDMLLTRLHGEGYAMWFPTGEYTPGAVQGTPVAEADAQDLRRYVQDNGLLTVPYPCYFSITQDAENDAVVLEFSEAPTEDLVFVMQFTKRTATLDSDGSTDLQTIDVPPRVVETLALMYAMNERGEEMGEAGNLAERRYIQALSTAKEKEIKAKEHGNRYDWSRE